MELPLGDDPRRARDLVQQVFELLTAQRGEVPFSLLLRAPTGVVEMDFPELGTSVSPAIEQRLSSLVGQGRYTWA